MNLPQRLRQLAASTGLDGFAHELRAIADEMEAQPADVTDERQAFEKWLGIRPCGAAHDLAWSAWKARAILALRPVQVPISRKDLKALMDEAGYGRVTAQERADFIGGFRHAEAHHGIKPKEQA